MDLELKNQEIVISSLLVETANTNTLPKFPIVLKNSRMRLIVCASRRLHTPYTDRWQRICNYVEPT